MLSAKFKNYSDSVLGSLMQVMTKYGISPNMLTIVGLFSSVLTALAFAYGKIGAALFFLILTALFDVFDGAAARVSNSVTQFGGFLDSVADRYADAFILLGLLVYLSEYYILIFTVLVGSMLVSYSRAKAESIIKKCDVGIAERAERLIILLAATFLEIFRIKAFYPALITLAILTHVTVFQRVIYTYTLMKKA